MIKTKTQRAYHTYLRVGPRTLRQALRINKMLLGVGSSLFVADVFVWGMILFGR